MFWLCITKIIKTILIWTKLHVLYKLMFVVCTLLPSRILSFQLPQCLSLNIYRSMVYYSIHHLNILVYTCLHSWSNTARLLTLLRERAYEVMARWKISVILDTCCDRYSEALCLAFSIQLWDSYTKKPPNVNSSYNFGIIFHSNIDLHIKKNKYQGIFWFLKSLKLQTMDVSLILYRAIRTYAVKGTGSALSVSFSLASLKDPCKVVSEKITNNSLKNVIVPTKAL